MKANKKISPIKKNTTCYFEENIIKYLEEIAVASGTSKNKVFRAAVKAFLIDDLKKKIKSDPEYQAILDDVKNTLRF